MKKSNHLIRPQSRALNILLLALFSSLSTVAESGASNPDFSKVRKLIQETMVQWSIPSISIAVARHGKILWEEAVGWADRENRIPATEHTMYYTASLDKPLTVLALMVLQERKQVDFDRPMNDYLGAAKLTSPAFNPAEATIRRVASHTAGLTTFNPITHLSMEETIRRYGVIVWPPGEQFDYSNLGFNLLDHVVARVSGSSYSDFFRAEVFWPLGMTHASVSIGCGLEKFIAQGYTYGTDPHSGLQPPIRGGVYCSAHDLARFGMFCLKDHLSDQKSILPDTAVDALYHSPVDMDGLKYSLGWTIEEHSGYASIEAHGGTTAAQASLRLIPSEDTAVAVLANSGMLYPPRVIDEILFALLPGYGEKQGEKNERKAAPKDSESTLPRALAGTWKGKVKTYREDLPLTFLITGSGDVHAKLGSQLTTLLNKPKFDGKRLQGRMFGDLNVEEDTGSERYELEFYLYLRDGALKGAVMTTPKPQLPFWAELKKESQLTEE